MRLKLRPLSNPLVACLLALWGFAAFFTGINNPFNQGDDQGQIVNNLPVHSIGNIGQFFAGGTYYYNQAGFTHLTGPYYRPLMTTVFSLLYTAFGPQPLFYHLGMEILLVAGAFILYLVFREFGISNIVALFLSLIFLVDPINSQIAFFIPQMQDCLFFFFGITALWLLLRFRSTAAVYACVLCVLLALFSKESAVIFVVVCGLYLLLWDRKRFPIYLESAVFAGFVWLALRAHAVGLISTNISDQPIHHLSLLGRLANDPWILSLYLSKLIWPAGMATGYYGVIPGLDLANFWLPLVADLTAIAAAVTLGLALQRKKLTNDLAKAYWFFGVCAVIGLLPHLQIIPLDSTATVVWFHFSMACVLGMVGIAVTALGAPRFLRKTQMMAAAIILVAGLGIGTALRGQVWGNTVLLYQQDVAASPDYHAYSDIAAIDFFDNQRCQSALANSLQSVALFPDGLEYDLLGQEYAALQQYQNANDAYAAGIRLVPSFDTYENWAKLTTAYGDVASDQQVLGAAQKAYPNDYLIWYYSAVFFQQHNDATNASAAVAKARVLDPANPATSTGVATFSSALSFAYCAPGK